MSRINPGAGLIFRDRWSRFWTPKKDFCARSGRADVDPGRAAQGELEFADRITRSTHHLDKQKRPDGARFRTEPTRSTESPANGQAQGQ